MKSTAVISIIFAIALCLILLPVSAFAGTTGDVDGDGVIAAADARSALRAAVGLESLSADAEKAADVDFDGEVTAADARLILRASVGLEVLHEHNYSEEKITIKATCTEDGEKKLSCSCGEFITEKIPAKGHKTVTDKAVAATCTKEGKTEGKHCSVCGTVTVAQKPVAKKAHKTVTDKAVAATCTKEGKTEGKHCSVCGTVTVAQKPVAKKAHKIVTDKAVAATCTKAGKTEGKHCSVCGTVTVAQKTVPASHKTVIDKAVAATCTKAGKTEGKHCSVCSKVITAQKTVAATGHKFNMTNPAAATKCSASGCSVKLPAFNSIVNVLKESGDGLDRFTGISKDENRYGKSEVGGMMAGEMGNAEIPEPEIRYNSLVVDRLITKNNFHTTGADFVSALTASDIKSMNVQKIKGIDFISELPGSFSDGYETFNIKAIKTAKFPEVYKISLVLPSEKIDIKKKVSGTSVYDRIYSDDYNVTLEKLRGEMLNQFSQLEKEMASLKDMISMKTAGSITSGLVVDYYVTTDDFTPVAAKYALTFDILLDIRVTDKLGISKLVTMKQPMTMTNSSYYFFNNNFGL